MPELEDFFGLNSIIKENSEKSPDDEIINIAFSDEEMKKASVPQPVLDMAQSEAISSFLSSNNDNDPVPFIYPTPYIEAPVPAPAPAIASSHQDTSIVRVKESRGSLKRKVIGTGSVFISKVLSRVGDDNEFSNNEENNRNKRYKKKICTSSTFRLGTACYTMVPSSAGRRLCQVICALGNWDIYAMFFCNYSDTFNSLRILCDNDMVENGIETKKGFGGNTYCTFLRATVQRALCTQGKGEDGEFVPLARYILQEKYDNSNSMNYDKIQSLLGAICKENKKIRNEFCLFEYSKIGPSRVALGVFNILIMKK